MYIIIHGHAKTLPRKLMHRVGVAVMRHYNIFIYNF